MAARRSRPRGRAIEAEREQEPERHVVRRRKFSDDEKLALVAELESLQPYSQARLDFYKRERLAITILNRWRQQRDAGQLVASNGRPASAHVQPYVEPARAATRPTNDDWVEFEANLAKIMRGAALAQQIIELVRAHERDET